MTSPTRPAPIPRRRRLPVCWRPSTASCSPMPLNAASRILPDAPPRRPSTSGAICRSARAISSTGSWRGPGRSRSSGARRRSRCARSSVSHARRAPRVVDEARAPRDRAPSAGQGAQRRRRRSRLVKHRPAKGVESARAADRIPGAPRRLVRCPRAAGRAQADAPHRQPVRDDGVRPPEDLVVYALQGRYEVDASTPRRATTPPSSAARPRSEGYDVVVAFGGDGTVNEVANGLARSPPRSPACPAARRTSTARCSGSPATSSTRPSTCCAVADDWRPRRIDLGPSTAALFTFSAGYGLDASVVRRVDAHPRLSRACATGTSPTPRSATFTREYVVRPPRLEVARRRRGPARRHRPRAERRPLHLLLRPPAARRRGRRARRRHPRRRVLERAAPLDIPTVIARLFSDRLRLARHRAHHRLHTSEDRAHRLGRRPPRAAAGRRRLHRRHRRGRLRRLARALSRSSLERGPRRRRARRTRRERAPLRLAAGRRRRAGRAGVFLRSAAKPLQALPAVQAGVSSAWDSTTATSPLACASHGGSPEHVARVAEVLAACGLGVEDALACGPLAAARPGGGRAPCAGRRGASTTTARASTRSGSRCACARAGRSTATSTPRHPLQRAMADAVAGALGVDGARPGDRRLRDADLRAPLAAAGGAFGRLAGGGLGARDARVRGGHARPPGLVAYPGAIDTELMRADARRRQDRRRGDHRDRLRGRPRARGQGGRRRPARAGPGRGVGGARRARPARRGRRPVGARAACRAQLARGGRRAPRGGDVLLADDGHVVRASDRGPAGGRRRGVRALTPCRDAFSPPLPDGARGRRRCRRRARRDGQRGLDRLRQGRQRLAHEPRRGQAVPAHLRRGLLVALAGRRRDDRGPARHAVRAHGPQRPPAQRTDRRHRHVPAATSTAPTSRASRPTGRGSPTGSGSTPPTTATAAPATSSTSSPDGLDLRGPLHRPSAESENYLRDRAARVADQRPPARRLLRASG